MELTRLIQRLATNVCSQRPPHTSSEGAATDFYADLKIKQRELGFKYAAMQRKAKQDYDWWYYENIAAPTIQEAFEQERDALWQFYGLPARHIRKVA